MHIISLPTFLDYLNRSNLLRDEQLADARTATAQHQDSINLGAWLVKQGWLTRWQVQQLLAGRTNLYLGKYKLLEVLGRGGMGGVLKAEQTGLGRMVALKVMIKELVNDRNAILRFHREMRSAAALDHPNIISAIDADCVGDQHFLVMEYVDGKDLKAWLKEHGQLPIDWVCECIRQAALGLQHAHEQGMVHRDIKPANLLVSNEEGTGRPVVKILDLGLACLTSEIHGGGGITRTGQIIGSPDYIAPEQAQNAKTSDIRADIFSLGVSLFQLVTGQLPYDGDNLMEKLMSRVTKDPIRLRSLRPDVSPELDRVVDKMVARLPEHRFQTPGEVATALTTLIHGQTQSTPGVPATMPISNVSTEVTFQPQLDATLNEFIDYLTDGVEGTPIASTSSRSDSRRRSMRPSKNWPKWIGIGAVVVCLVVGMFLRWQDSFENAQVRKPTPEKRDNTVANTTKSPDNSTRSESEDDNPHRRLAQFAFEIGTGVVVRLGRDQIAISQSENLPDRPFEVVKVDLDGLPRLHTTELQLLADVSSLQSINFSGSGLSDDNLIQLNRLAALKSLDLGSTLVSDVGATQLARLTNLTKLNLRFTSVSNVGLQALRPLLQLSELNLEGTDITDSAITELQNWKNLKSLMLRYTFLSNSAVNKLKRTLPDCRIEH